MPFFEYQRGASIRWVQRAIRSRIRAVLCGALVLVSCAPQARPPEKPRRINAGPTSLTLGEGETRANEGSNEEPVPDCECEGARLTFAVKSPCPINTGLELVVTEVGGFKSKERSFNARQWMPVTTAKPLHPKSELKFLDVVLSGTCTDDAEDIAGNYLCKRSSNCTWRDE